VSDAGGFTVGDGGIFSTINDLLKWDKALYTEKLVKKSTLNEAFTPATLNSGTSSPYGFGWMLKEYGGEKIVYHTGGSGGFRTYLERRLNSHDAIIILTNMENSPRREISDAIVNILKGKSYQLPKISIASEMYTVRNTNGIDSAIQFYAYNKQKNSNIYDFSEQELNLLGYKLWSIKKINEAIGIFKLNVIAYPASSNTYESLGEAYKEHGDKQLAISNFNKSLELDRKNSDAIRMLKQMGVK
jgi:tetratricopeptide (TPR) repeat protein